MKIIVDSNIIISALLYNSAKRMIIVLSGLDFYYPRSSQKEISKYKKEILEKSGITESEYEEVLNLLFKKIHIIEEDEIQNYLSEASELIGNIDPKDVPFIACALAYPNSVMWSDDRHFEKQNKIKILKQKDILDYINKD